MLTALCLVIFALISPTFWHDFIAQTPVHVLAIAGAVAGIVQIIKRLAPDAIQGRWIVITNTVLSIAGILVTNGTTNFWTETTWAQIVIIVIGASGLHTTAKTMTGLSITPDSSKSTSPGAAVLAMVLTTALLTGCGIRAATPPTAPASLPAGAADSIDAHANQVLQTIQAFMKPIVRDIQNGKLQATPTQRAAINNLDGLYNKAIVAEQGYHACMFTPETTQAACLTTSAINGALSNAQAAFTSAQAALAAGVGP